ncbi:MAG TPA: serine/threonine-protein kinase [Polyangiaceae bacterium]
MLRRLLALLLVALALVGCGKTGEAEVLDHWQAEDGHEISLPAHLPVGKDVPFFTLRKHLALPAALRGGPLTLSITWLPALASLRVDGRDLPALDAPLSDRFRTGGAHRWRIPDDLAAKPALDLELRVENTWTQSSWLDNPPVLSRTPAGDRAFLATYAFDSGVVLLGVTTIAILTLLYLALYLRDRSRPQNLWFALEGAGALWYPAMMGGVLQPVFGLYDVAVAGPALALSSVATVQFTSAYLRLPKPSRLWWAGLALVVLAALVRGGPFGATQWVAPPTCVLLFANAGYHLRLLRRFLRAGARPTNLFIVTLSWPLAVVVGSTDFAAWLGLGDPFHGVRAGSLGMSAVAVLQSVALAREHVKSLREVELLNDELRRQVAARSRQLADALARLGAAPKRAAELAPGDEVDGRYRIVRALGQGGAGKVYEVERLSDGQALALKIVTAATDPRMLARAAREAQLASEVRHANVVSIVDVDVSSEGYLFLVMELVDGRSLREERARFGDAAWALPVLAQIARGLEAIHARGIVHRDLKPANVLLAGPDGDTASVVKIADFGIANVAPEKSPSRPPPALDEDAATVVDRKMAPALDPTITATGDLLGTPHYMAPEIVPLGVKAAQPPADVFAFGVIAFEMLAGRRPYENMPTFLGLALAPAPSSFATLAPSLPAATAALLDRCLAREPRDRPSAAELAPALSSSRLG